jgi:glycosyltransferase involved in cell wall biosynthesis
MGIPIERLQVGLTLARADLVIAPSREAADAALAHQVVARRRVGVLRVPLPVDCDRFRPGDGGTGYSLLHVADMNPVKDQSTLLAAFGTLARRDARATLALVGAGSRVGALRRQARELRLQDRIAWWGRIPHSAMHQVYRRCDAFALSSLHEAQSVALAEAAASGLPIATTAVGIARELPSGGAFLASPRDPESLARAMSRALEAPVTARMGLAESARRTYGVPEADRRLTAALRRAVGARRGRES